MSWYHPVDMILIHTFNYGHQTDMTLYIGGNHGHHTDMTYCHAIILRCDLKS